jgi:diaminopimelate epimerase
MVASHPFTKMQAVGNDFVVVETAHWPDNADWHTEAIRLCDRRFGIGGDGLLLIQSSGVADIRMRMFNPDGTEDMCGNGLRCVIRYAVDHGLLNEWQGTTETLDGIHPFVVHANGAITVEMGQPHFAPEDIPVDRTQYRERFQEGMTNERLFVGLPGGSIIVDAVNTGSTHAVLWREQLPADREFFHNSPLIEHARMFPERTSVLWAVIKDPLTVQMRIWERGVGETLGCGTGACAVAVLGRRNGKLAPTRDISVLTKGGTLSVSWEKDDNAPMYLTGTAHIVYSGNTSDTEQ